MDAGSLALDSPWIMAALVVLGLVLLLKAIGVALKASLFVAVLAVAGVGAYLYFTGAFA